MSKSQTFTRTVGHYIFFHSFWTYIKYIWWKNREVKWVTYTRHIYIYIMSFYLWNTTSNTWLSYKNKSWYIVIISIHRASTHHDFLSTVFPNLQVVNKIIIWDFLQLLLSSCQMLIFWKELFNSSLIYFNLHKTITGIFSGRN